MTMWILHFLMMYKAALVLTLPLPIDGTRLRFSHFGSLQPPQPRKLVCCPFLAMSVTLPKLLKGIAKTRVDSSNMASQVAKGALPVFGTPFLIGLAEKAAFDVVEKQLDPSMTTVGTRLDMRHLAATPLGMDVTAEATLVKQEKKTLEFDINVVDSTQEKVGEGKHWRAIVDKAKFMARVEAKAKSA